MPNFSKAGMYLKTVGGNAWGGRKQWMGAIPKGAGYGSIIGGVQGGLTSDDGFFNGAVGGAFRGAMYGGIGYGGYKAYKNAIWQGPMMRNAKNVRNAKRVMNATGYTRGGVGGRVRRAPSYRTGGANAFTRGGVSSAISASVATRGGAYRTGGARSFTYGRTTTLL